ncbi:MAG: biopolymer transporter ExbD [Gammaproteobacteria bacterium]
MRRKIKRSAEEAEINMTPMLDIVFIMLIFFIVTTSFARESGLSVSRPSNEPDKVKKESEVILIEISETGQVRVSGRSVDIRAVRANVERNRAEKPDASVVVVAHRDADAGLLVQVIDQARQAGAQNVSIASTAT